MNADGTATSFDADSAHPLDCEDLLVKFETAEQVAVLNFTEKPDRILTVKRLTWLIFGLITNAVNHKKRIIRHDACLRSIRHV